MTGEAKDTPVQARKIQAMWTTVGEPGKLKKG
jgi:hypothetical protein